MESAASEEFDFGLTDAALLGLDMRAAATAAARAAPALDVAADLRLVTNLGLRPRSSMGTRARVWQRRAHADLSNARTMAGAGKSSDSN